MKIKLKMDLPIPDSHGATKGKEFEVHSSKKLKGRGASILYYFKGIDGIECGAYDYEVEVIDED